MGNLDTIMAGMCGFNGTISLISIGSAVNAFANGDNDYASIFIGLGIMNALSAAYSLRIAYKLKER